LNSPNVIPIHHYGEIDGRLYLDMHLIKGRDLAAVLAEGPLEPSRAVRIIGQVAEALHAAHEEGLLHRDIKPSNILLDKNDFAYLIDFGIVRTLGETRMTQTGSAIGTFQYIAPERLGTGAEDARADIYSLACVLYECLTGHPPFLGDTMGPLVNAHLNTPPPRPSINQPNVPPAVDEVIATGMAKEPDQRYATTVELADAARDAITTPIARPAPAPTVVPTTQRARKDVPAHPSTVKAASLAPAKHPHRQLASPAPARADGISRPVLVALIVGAVIFVVLPLAGIAITIWGGHSSPSSSQPSSRPPHLSQTVLLTGLSQACGVAVDGNGNVYVAGGGNHKGWVSKLATGSSTPTVLPFSDLGQPNGLAVDNGGNLYVTDGLDNNRVLKLAAGSSTPTPLPFTGLKFPQDVAVDGIGNVTDDRERVLELATGSSTQTVVPFSGLNAPYSVAVDSTGSVYVTDLSGEIKDRV
jgi:serine/threonine protein kinase, bacterial